MALRCILHDRKIGVKLAFSQNVLWQHAKKHLVVRQDQNLKYKDIIIPDKTSTCEVFE